MHDPATDALDSMREKVSRKKNIALLRGRPIPKMFAREKEHGYSRASKTEVQSIRKLHLLYKLELLQSRYVKTTFKKTMKTV